MKNSNMVAYYSAMATAAITIVTFGLALMAIPIAGANCPADCIAYPYLDTVSQFPRDYLWMLPAIVLILAYLVLAAAIHVSADEQRRVFSQIALTFAAITAVILVGDYFVQFSTIPVSLMHGETEGIALLTQYNAHGIFIALEELGYLMMSLSFLFLAPVFAGRNRLEAAIRSIFVLDFLLVIVSLIVVAVAFGLDRQDRFEVVAISINWLVLIVNGILLSALFKKRLRAE